MTIASWLKSLLRKTGTIRRGRGKAPSPRRRRLLCCEWLEDRIVPFGGGGGGAGGAGTLYWLWIGNAGDGNWDTGGNWSFTPGSDWNGGQANAYPGQGKEPGELDVVSIDTGSTAATITVQSFDSLFVQGLTTTADDTLSIIGNLTLEADSTLDGPLSLTGGTMTATDSGVTVTANGTTTATAANLFALGGAALNLPNLSTYDNATTNTTELQSLGSGSLLELPGLANLGSLDATLNISVQDGGTFNLPALVLNSSTPNIAFDAEGSGSQINIPSPTALDGDSVFLDVGGTIPLGQMTSFTNGSLDVVGESVTLTSLTDADGSSLTAEEGSSLSLPNLTSSSASGSFTASGPGSVVDLSALSTVGGSGVLNIQAVQGGEINLFGLTNYNNPNANLTIQGGGTMDFSAGLANMPASANAPIIVVPTLPEGVPLNLVDTAASATFNIAMGDTVDVTGGTFTGGTSFNVGAEATVDVTGGTFTGGANFNVAQSGTVALMGGTFSGTLSGSGSGIVAMPGNRVFIGIGGLTLNFQGDMFQWSGTHIDTALGNLINLGILNLTGDLPKPFDLNGELDNFGTIIQTGTGNLVIGTNGLFPATLKIEPGASYLIEGDSGMSENTEGTGPYSQQLSIINEGSIRKTGGTGISVLSLAGVIVNTGTIEADSGTLNLNAFGLSQVSNGTLTQGTWNALNGSILEFPPGTAITSNQASVTLSGAGARIDGIGGLNSNNGSFTVTDGAKFSTIRNFTTSGNLTNGGTLIVGAGSTLTVSGNYTQTTAGTLDTQLGGTPASGQFGQLAVTGSAALAGNFGVALVPGFGPTAGQDFRPLTFATVAGTFASLTGLYPFFTASLNPTSLDLVESGTNPVDLVASSITAPTTATAGQPITVNWQVNNPGSQAALGNWQDSVYLSTTPSITSISVLLGTAKHTGGLAAGGSYTGTWTGAVPALAPDFYYVLVQVDSLYTVADPDRSNNTLAASTGQIVIAVPSLTPGIPYSDAFAAADQDHYYQVTVPAGGTLVVSLASEATSGGVALYIGQGILPTPYNYQEAATTASQPSPTVTVPQVLTAGIYYILAHSIAGSAATAAYTLTATQATGLTVSAPATPYTGGNGGNVTVEIDGTDFTPAIAANLTLLGGTPIPASAIDFVSASQIYATFGLAGAALGNYVLTVSEGVQSATSSSSFQVMPAVSSAGLLTINLSLPQYVRSGRTGTFTITYTNASNNDMVAPLLDIETTNSNVFFSTPADPNDFTQDAQVLAIAPSGPAGILRPGQTGQLTLTLLSDDTISNDSIPVQVNQVEAGQAIDWASQKTALQPSSIPAGSWNVIFANLLATVGTTTDSYNAALARAATYLGSLGETTAQVSDVSHLWAFLVSQANAAFPTSTLSSAVDASLSTPGNLSLAIERTFVSTIAGRNQEGIFGLGWTSSWQMSLSVDGSGNVTIEFAGSFAFFPAQSIGTHANTDVEYGTLTLSGDIYTYTDTGGDQYVFSPNGDLNYAQVNDGNRITLGYNGQNQLSTLTYSSTTDSSEPTERLTLTYNAQGFVSGEADGTGDIWTYSYDTAGHLLSVQGPMGLTTSYTYDTGTNPETANTLLSITSPDGSQQNFTYDPNTGRLTGTSGNGGADTVTYSYLGEAEVRATDAAADQTTIWYNDLGRVSRTEDPRGAITSSVYDNNGNLLTYTDAAGQTYQYTYDSNSNVTQAVNPLGQTVQMTYNSHSDLTSITDARGNTTQYNYSPTDNLLSITYPDGTQQSFSYDPLGNLSETVLQNGAQIGAQYNAQGLTTQQTFADGSSQTMTYDTHGNLLTANSFDASGNPTGTTTLTYNAANELTSIAYPNGQYLDFFYNVQGQRTQSVDQSGYTVNYSYDALGRLSQLTNPPGQPGGSATLIVQYTYNDLGQLQEKLNGNGTYTTYAYDAAGDLTQEINYAGGTTVNSSFAYTYNVLGEQTSMTDAAGNLTRYGYDATGQLTSITLPGNATIQYVYNAASDRTEVLNSGLPTAYASNADNEITQVGSTIYTYDQNGNLHTVTDPSGTTTYTYNDLNELVSISASDGSITNFQYSPLGFLVGTTVTSSGVSSQTNYLVDPTGLSNVVASYNGDGSLIADYTYGLGLVSQTGPKGTGFYDFDASGNTIGITGSSGTYVNQYSYLPFGETTVVSATLPNPFTFAGQAGVIQIGTQLFSMRARDYTPVTGQFTSNDPTGLSGGDTDLRRYVANEPNSFVDPSGLDLGPAFSASGEGQDYINGGFSDSPDSYLDPHFPDYVPPAEPASYNNQTFFPENANKLLTDLDSQIPQAQDNEESARSRLANTPRPMFMFIPIGDGIDYDERQLTEAEKHTNELLARRDSALRYQQNLVKQFKNDGPQKIATNTKAQDPNALIGPGGFGTPNFLTSTGTWPYTIDFENDGSAAALVVTVTEQLDANLDWTTFQLGSFGWGPVNITVPTALTEYQTTVSYQNSDGTPLNVLVSINFNVETGLLTVTFTSLDPLLGATPTGVFDGFLYPEDGSGNGEGYVQYTVQPKANLATGTVINQQASVVFDTNPALATDTSLVTIDNGPPTSSVTTLPAYSLGSFTVAWSGQDDTGGSGIASYNVYVSDNSGPFTLWQQNVTQTSATFTGQNGHTYGFYSIATDNVGNVQPMPSVAQATTTVDSVAPSSSVSALPAYSLGSFTLSWSGSDNSGGSGLASYSVFVSDNNGAFTPLLTNTTKTSTTFTGQNGHVYGFYSIATDVAGNVQSTPSTAQASTIVESVAPPAPSITSEPGSTSSSSSATFVFTDSQNGVSFLSKLDSGTYAAASSPQTFTGLGNGNHTFNVEAKDQAGNVSLATSYTWTINLPKSPTVVGTQIDDGTKQRSMVRSLTLSFSSSIAATLSTVMGQLALTRVGGLPTGQTLILNGSLDSTGTVLTLTFSGTSVIGGSLMDGRYILTCGNITVLSSSQLWRLYGDLYGTASVTTQDLAAFNAAMNSRKGMGNYSAYFDFDENGWITNNDQTEFKKRLGTSI